MSFRGLFIDVSSLSSLRLVASFGSAVFTAKPVECVMKKDLVSLLLVCCLLVPRCLCAEQYPELDYENNTGFKQEVPEELRRELPMCDEFLDVHWIREMPDRKNWVGRVAVDIKKDGKKEQRELRGLIR
ncbi:MAG: hypothetical protein CSB23_00890 [Deltaproteobacteria bacterium]|nr:MAG: hypothetical protein CSB23_00890 [Deltaproteobacteria bacterium]